MKALQKISRDWYTKNRKNNDEAIYAKWSNYATGRVAKNMSNNIPINDNTKWEDLTKNIKIPEKKIYPDVIDYNDDLSDEENADKLM